LTISAQVREDDEQRARSDKIGEVFRLMNAQPGAVVAEVGAGPGFFPVRLSPVVGPRGKVYAVDINDEAVKRLRKRVEEDELANVEVVKGAADNPNLPRGEMDAILTVVAYHEMTRYKAMLRRMRESLKPAGKLVLIDMIKRRAERRRDTRKKLTESHEIAPEMVERELKEAGFRVVEKRDPFLDRANEDRIHFLFVAEPA
jgi:ubiquinone/menaquinone biosynthesis C-methylase UbiE